MYIELGCRTWNLVCVCVSYMRRTPLLFCIHSCLHVQVVSQYSNQLAPLSVDAVLTVIDPATATNVDLRDIKVIKKLG